MKTLHFDCFAGISGDMTLGALVDLGVPPEQLRSQLNTLGISDWSLDFVKDERGGICGTRAIVSCAQAERGGCAHRHWSDIKKLLETSALAEGAKKRALDIFSLIAKVEAEVHGVKVEDVAFHEVGALDSIIDIAGAAVCLDILSPDYITAGEVELGGGTVRCAHGVLPVPAPATLALCKGMPVKTGGFDKEMTTPTGAAILATSVNEFIKTANFRELKTGYGLGERKLDKPNVLRVSWRETDGAAPPAPYIEEELFLLETNIDDMTGEEIGFLTAALFEGGALDAAVIPCYMKKNRPAQIVSALCSREKLDALREIIFTKSSTLGLREIPVRRLSLPRKTGTFEFEGRVLHKKTAFFNGRPLRSKVEYDERAELAKEKNTALVRTSDILCDKSCRFAGNEAAH